MPAIWGTIFVSIAVAIPKFNPGMKYPLGDRQWLGQFGGGLATLGVAILGGLMVGFILKSMRRTQIPFRDNECWTTEYLDHDEKKLD